MRTLDNYRLVALVIWWAGLFGSCSARPSDDINAPDITQDLQEGRRRLALFQCYELIKLLDPEPLTERVFSIDPNAEATYDPWNRPYNRYFKDNAWGCASAGPDGLRHTTDDIWMEYDWKTCSIIRSSDVELLRLMGIMR